jgi:hypothetical protein
MYNPGKKFHELISSIQNEGCMSDSDALKIMSLTRQLIEKRKEQSKYSVLNLL